jgi:ABC-type multidrug transport system fused ATPase/permease subunit
VFDLGFYYLVPYTSIVLIVVLFHVTPYVDRLSEFMTLLGYWGLASPAFAYVCSFVFARATSAQQMMMMVNTLLALIIIGIILLLEGVGGDAISTPIRFMGMLIPNVCIGLSVWTFVSDGQLANENSTSIGDDGMLPVYVLLGEAIIYFVLAIAMENTQDKAAKGYAKTKIGTMDEVAADRCQPQGDNAKYLREMVESSKFKGFIFGMIILNMVVVVIDMSNENATNVQTVLIFDMLNYLFTFVFIAEMGFKLGGMGPLGYVKDPFNIFDGVLVLMSIAEIMMAGNSTFTAARTGKVAGKTGRMLKLLRLFKFAKMLRLLRYARFMQVAEYEVKQTHQQMMDNKKEELLRTKSSGRRESIVKRLSLLGGEYVEGSAVDVERKRITRRLSRRYTTSSVGGEDDSDDEAAAEAERNERGDAVAINNLVKVFERPGDLPPITATNDIGFGVRQGEIFSLLGPNGAGKSTVLNMMTGSIAPSSGEIYVLDKNISTQFDAIKSR